MENLSREELTNGKYWLITIKYPSVQDASNYEVVKSDVDPQETYIKDAWEDLVEEVINDYIYLDHPEDMDEDEYESFYENLRQEVEIYSELITEDDINNYGVDWLNSYLVDIE